MDLDEVPIIHGLELPSRCLCPQSAETNFTRFLVATQSLRQENQIHFIEFDDENNVIDKTIYCHPLGEVWHLSSSFNKPDLFTTCYRTFENGKILSSCAILRLPIKKETSDTKSTSAVNFSSDSSTGQLERVEEVALLNTDEFGDASSCHWQPVDEENNLMVIARDHMILYDVGKSRPELVSSFSMPNRKGHPCMITSGRWNPHHGGKQFAVATEQNIVGWDVRSKTQAFHIDNAHGQLVREVDFNPNKMYYMVSCGDDCQVKFWDTRYPEDPVKVLSDDHSHWVWSTRYNPFHDQLLLSCGSDSKVILYNMASVSSEPYGHSIISDDEDDESSSEDETDLSEKQNPLEDGLVGVFEEHEDSVYAVEWSSAEPWTFASLSYDGRLVINRVPKKVKYSILL